MNYIFIDSRDKDEMLGLVEDNRLVEFYIEEKTNRKIFGNIYRGRVDKVVVGIDAAFIDIGREKNAYLHINQAKPRDLIAKDFKYKIDDLLKEGQEVIVQVTKEEVGTKGAKLSTYIELKGRYIILTPYSKSISISKKIEKNQSQRLLSSSQDVVKEEVGFIIRTAARDMEIEKIRDEYNILFERYKKIERERSFLPCPKLIYSEGHMGYQIIRDIFSEHIDQIKVNSKNYYDDLILMEEDSLFKFSDKLLLDKDFSIGLDQNLLREIRNSLNRKVELKSGAYLIIDQLEALTVIDINTGKFTGANSLKDTVMETNLEAALEIARQIRLRDIGGIIIVDFIDMKSKEDENKLLAIFNSYLKRDRNKARIVDISKLGLVELVRTKRRKSSTSKYYSICSECQGLGKVFIDI